MFEDSEGDLLEDYADYLESGAHLAVMPVARLSLQLSPLAFPGGTTFYSDVQTEKLCIVPNDLKSHSLAEHASATSGIDEEVLFRQPVVVFPIRFDWHRFRSNSHKANMEFIRKLSDQVDRTCLNVIRYHQCPIFTNGDWIDNLPGRAGQINSNQMMAGALLYNNSLREARIIAGDAFTHIITRGLGLSLEEIDQSEFPQDGEVGFIVRHALFLYTAMLEASNPTGFFIQALALLEFLAYPDEYRKFEDVKKVIARYVAKNPSEYQPLLDRLFVLTGKREADTGRIIGYRTRLVHMGERIEDILPEEEQRKLLFFELDGYIRSVIDHMIKYSQMSFAYYLTIRAALRPYEA